MGDLGGWGATPEGRGIQWRWPRSGAGADCRAPRARPPAADLPPHHGVTYFHGCYSIDDDRPTGRQPSPQGHRQEPGRAEADPCGSSRQPSDLHHPGRSLEISPAHPVYVWKCTVFGCARPRWRRYAMCSVRAADHPNPPCRRQPLPPTGLPHRPGPGWRRIRMRAGHGLSSRSTTGWQSQDDPDEVPADKTSHADKRQAAAEV